MKSDFYKISSDSKDQWDAVHHNVPLDSPLHTKSAPTGTRGEKAVPGKYPGPVQSEFYNVYL